MSNLSNSFYYFFSAVPQVLGAVLALFGVFVIFKIQSLKEQMIEISQPLVPINYSYDDLTNLQARNPLIEKYLKSGVLGNISKLRESFRLFEIALNDAYDETLQNQEPPKDVTLTRAKIHDFKQQVIKLLDKIRELKDIVTKFNGFAQAYQSLIDRTIMMSIITVVMIISCLTIIALGVLILQGFILPYILLQLLLSGSAIFL